ncbi:3-deoxy-D-manno-octulosonate 8-phosphate phosphatase [Aliarcobacter butzleri 7h1h]|uniref:KdsC family phosphatase n=1 Tax=Aliarcobacter butzleri TaxID=28197 RepID=UPI00035B9E27|nr:HAD hydrolase family protein [Aliarcobacter butzleri]AGR76976.1 3-deoxy-D-manno-octulosonate 8-phosphate phosphatase [Aliarcobacter butzleri 7h1h]
MISEILREIEWVFFDVDGVMTDGKLYYGPNGEEHKVFNVKDGHGLKMIKDAGIKIAVISGRGNDALLQRLSEMKFDIIKINRSDKGNVFNELFEEYGNQIENSIAIGDDIPDLEIFARTKLGFAVANAVTEVKNQADVILDTNGGEGAIRELCEIILSSRS